MRGRVKERWVSGVRGQGSGLVFSPPFYGGSLEIWGIFRLPFATIRTIIPAVVVRFFNLDSATGRN